MSSKLPQSVNWISNEGTAESAGGANRSEMPGNDAALLDAYSKAVISVVRQVGPAVVSVSGRSRSDGGGLGSGFVISPDGLAITNIPTARFCMAAPTPAPRATPITMLKPIAVPRCPHCAFVGFIRDVRCGISFIGSASQVVRIEAPRIKAAKMLGGRPHSTTNPGQPLSWKSPRCRS